MAEVMLSENLVRLLAELSPGRDVNEQVRELLRNEIVRRINRYELLGRRFRQKYGMDLEAFRASGMVEQKGFSFEVESDYCDWEMAVTGVQALKEQLAALDSEDA